MPKLLRPFTVGALVLFLAAGLGAFAFDAASALTSQAGRDYTEGIVLWQAANVTDWRKAFRPVEDYPHIVFHYTPLYHLIARLVARATGDLLVAGRLVSILSLIGSCAVAALLAAACLPARGSRAARWLGALCAGLFIFATPVWIYASFMRVDVTAAFLSLAGIALFVAARRRPALDFLAFACFVAAVCTKQTMVAAPAACLLLAFLERPRRSLYLLAFATSVGLAILFVLQALTGGMFLRHVVGYNQNPFLLRQMFGWWVAHLSTLPASLTAVALLFPAALLARKARPASGLLRRVRLALIRSDFERCVVVAAAYFWLAAAVVTLTIGKQGANSNYFIELDLAASLLFGLFVGWLVRRALSRPRGTHALLACLLIPLLLLHTVGNVLTLYKSRKRLSPPDNNDSAEVVRLIQELPGPVYSDDMVMLMRAGKEIPAEPAIITALTMSGGWDEASFVSRIERGEFQAIVVRYVDLDDRVFFTESVAQAVRQHYSLRTVIGSFKIYLPNKAKS